MWLQSIDGAEGARKPLIRPQHAFVRHSANGPETSASNVSSRTESSDRRRSGNLISSDLIAGKVTSANAGSNNSPRADNSADATTATRPNNGVNLAAPDAPRFTTDNQPNSQAEANAGQIEVPVPPSPRSADASLAIASGSGPDLRAPAMLAASQNVIAA